MKHSPRLTDALKQRRLEEFRQRCLENGVPFTRQRRIILEAVLDLDTHPTADAVYSSASVCRAGISRATVYRTLENLVRLGAITKTCHTGGKIRYDRRTEIHHHMICLRCDAVEDINDAKLDAVSIPDTSAFGFDVKDFRVQLRGLCRRCSKMEDKS